MFVLRTNLYKTVWYPLAFLAIFHTRIQCSSRSVREVLATVKGFITITCHYDTYQYKNLGSSWCRQISVKDCDNILQTRGFSSSVYKERVNVSQIMDHFGTVNVTMFNLQHWDTGLYNWRVWTGTEYEVIQTVLLQVVNGLPSNIHVARFKLNEMAEIHCEYALNDTTSKVWYKKTHDNRYQWVAHSSGRIATDYESRITVINEQQKKRVTVKFLKPEIWDSGTYQCKESVRSRDIFTEILLIITMDSEMLTSPLMPPTTSSEQNAKTWLPVNSESKTLSPNERITKFSDPNIYYPTNFPEPSTLNNATQQPKLPRLNKPWNILRWILFLSMVLCCVFFSCYKRSSGISDVRQIYIPARRSQDQNRA